MIISRHDNFIIGRLTNIYMLFVLLPFIGSICSLYYVNKIDKCNCLDKEEIKVKNNIYILELLAIIFFMIPTIFIVYKIFTAIFGLNFVIQKGGIKGFSPSEKLLYGLYMYIVIFIVYSIIQYYILSNLFNFDKNEKCNKCVEKPGKYLVYIKLIITIIYLLFTMIIIIFIYPIIKYTYEYNMNLKMKTRIKLKK